MKRVLLFLLLLLPMFVLAQPGGAQAVIISKDSIDGDIGFELNDGWRFNIGDDTAAAAIDFDDSKWDIVNSALEAEKDKEWAYKNFNSIGWLRLHFVADTSIVNTPLALHIEQYGASEVYLDGKKIADCGRVGIKDSTIYYNPHNTPVTFVLSKAGPHVIAVRYANYNAKHNNDVYNNGRAGFEMYLQAADDLFREVRNNLVSLGFIMTILCGIFFALCISHLFLFFYNQSQQSNLYFSLFCFYIACAFFIPWLSSVVTAPVVQLSNHFTGPVVISGICISMSGFVNNLFSASKKRFAVVVVICVSIPFVFWLCKESSLGLFGYIFVIAVVALEVIVLTIRALIKKVKGAWIIGVGVLLFTVLMFFTMVYMLIYHDINFGSNNPWELAYFGTLAFAILCFPISMSLYLAWSFASVNKELKKNLAQVEELSAKTIQQEVERIRLVETQNEKLEAEVSVRTAEVVSQKEEIEKQHEELKKEKNKSDSLLLNILPAEVADELKEKGYSDAKSFNNVSVLFTDFVNFTIAGEHMSPQELVDELHICFKTFDEIISKHGIEKIKTIGDAYLAVGGLPVADENHAINAVKAAIEIRQFMLNRRKELNEKTFQIRIGIHSGGVVAGIVGIKKFAYDIWGDTVNTAARMEQNSEPDKINVSESTYLLVKDRFRCTHRGKIDAKNKGELNMYFVEPE